jgi:hypothetical protein
MFGASVQKRFLVEATPRGSFTEACAVAPIYANPHGVH